MAIESQYSSFGSDRKYVEARERSRADIPPN
jgi:hypothetical protein